MALHRKKKALYEVIGRNRRKLTYANKLEPLNPKSDTANPNDAQPSQVFTPWPYRPRILQFNAGRIELSMPYPLAIAMALAVVLLVLVVFRAGQNNYTNKTQPAEPTAPLADMSAEAPVKTKIMPEGTDLQRSKGNNRIVIQTWQEKNQLEPVKQYFTENGIETEIRQINGMYYLLTRQKYENPQRRNTDGYIAKQRIIELGKKYKAPAGYSSFGSKPFYDAYGMKFDD